MEAIKYLTRNEFKKLCETIENSDCINKLRDLTMIMLAEYCGLRISEAINMKKNYYIREVSEIFCPRMKDSNSNTLKILDKDIIKVLNYYLDTNEYSNAIVHAFQKFRAPFSGKIVHIFPEQSAVI